MHSTGTAVASQGLSNTRRTNDLLHEDNQRALAGQNAGLKQPRLLRQPMMQIDKPVMRSVASFDAAQLL
jgi:hypothetical protein